MSTVLVSLIILSENHSYSDSGGAGMNGAARGMWGAFSSEAYSSSYRTKIKVAQALNQLCENAPYEKIHVDDIVKAADLSRSGFYYHFQDKNAIVLWLSDQCYATGLDETGRTLTWFEGHVLTTRMFNEFNTLFVAAADNREYRGGQPYYVRHRQQTLIDTLTKYHRKQLTPLLQFQIEALPYAEKVMANKFAAGELDLSLKEYCEMAVSLVPRELYEALAEPINPVPRGMLFI